MSSPSRFLQQAPGFSLRRMHQLSVALFMDATDGAGLTPVQYAILTALLGTPGEDQVTLARKVALDAATSGSVIGRLEAKGWLRRETDRADRRRKLLWITPQGQQMVESMAARLASVESALMAPLTEAESDQFAQLLHKLVSGHDGTPLPS
jgi:DNA-binding MarR family transcriptional regulator